MHKRGRGGWQSEKIWSVCWHVSFTFCGILVGLRVLSKEELKELRESLDKKRPSSSSASHNSDEDDNEDDDDGPEEITPIFLDLSPGSKQK